MTIKNLLIRQRNDSGNIYLLPQGAFFHTYNEGALLVSEATGYKIRESECHKGGEYIFCGFPFSALDKVIIKVAQANRNKVISVSHEDTMTIINIE